MAATAKNLRSAWAKKKKLRERVRAEPKKKNFDLAVKIMNGSLETSSSDDEPKK